MCVCVCVYIYISGSPEVLFELDLEMQHAGSPFGCVVGWDPAWYGRGAGAASAAGFEALRN